MTYYSVKDQYCQDGQAFHQTVYLGSKECEVPWYLSLFSPQEQVFTKYSCLYGFKLKSCGPCPEVTQEANSEHHEAEQVLYE